MADAVGTAETLREARARYFVVAGLGADGGYADRWVRLKVGWLRLAFPNTAARVRAVRIHDLHHALTGYGTDWQGECEIAAWEIARGCRGFVAAWILNLFAFSAGCLMLPGRTLRALVRGRRSANLYGVSDIDSTLDHTVSEVRKRLGLDASPDPPRAADRAAFLLWSGAALVHLALWLAVAVGLPIFVALGWAGRLSSP